MKYQNNSTNINGMQISYVSSTSIQASAGDCYDSTNSLFIQFVDTVVLDATKVGANGLDTGSLQANTWYYVFAIYDQSAMIGPSLLLSLSETAPYLPKGFSAFRMIGRAVRTDGSGNILKFYRRGALNLRKHFWDQAIQVVSGGSATTETVFSCAAAIPPVETVANLNLEFTPEAAGQNLQVSAPGSTTTYGGILSGVVAAVAQKSFTSEAPCSIVTGAASLQYMASHTGCTVNIYVNGYEDPLL